MAYATKSYRLTPNVWTPLTITSQNVLIQNVTRGDYSDAEVFVGTTIPGDADRGVALEKNVQKSNMENSLSLEDLASSRVWARSVSPFAEIVTLEY